VTAEEVREALAQSVTTILEPTAVPLSAGDDPAKKPHVVLVVGVNGSGKTTTIGKLAHQLRGAGKSVMLCAGDTFRAAAIEQLQIWGERVGAPIVARGTGADAAGLAFDAYKQAQAEGVDVLLIDTAGRLHNKKDLMDELSKIVRVLKKLDETTPHDVVMVLDATTGQNALQQVQVFRELISVTGLVVTKLDGTAKAGVLVALAEKFGLPVHAVGVGETADDLRPFRAEDYAKSLMGLAEG
jgi:fused signal recognition particle receptor